MPRRLKTARIVTVQAPDGMGAVQLIDATKGYVLLHQGYCRAAEWQWHYQIVRTQADYLGYRIIADERHEAPLPDPEQLADSDDTFQPALPLEPADHDYQLKMEL